MPGGTLFRDPEGRLRTVWRLVLFFVVWVLIQFGVGIPVLIVVGLFLGRAAPSVVFAVLIPVVTAAGFSLVWAFRTAVDRREPSTLGMASPGPRLTQSPWVALAVGVCMAALPFLALLVSGRLAVEGAGVSVFALLMLPLLVIAAFHEELVFRGYVLQNIRESGHPAAGVLVTAALFTGFHAANPHFWSQPFGAATIFAAGLLLGGARLLSGNLWFPTALHFGWNAVQGPVFGVPISGIQVKGFLRVSGEPAVTSEFGLEGSPLGLGVTLVVAGVLLTMLLLGGTEGGRSTEEAPA